VLSVVFRDPYGCWGFLDLWRIGAAASPFSSREAGFLVEAAPAVTAAVRRAQAATFTSTPEGRPPGPVVLLLSSELALLAQTPQTDAYLRELVPPEGGAAPVPAGAYNVGAQLLAIEAGVDGHPPVARVHLRAGQWLSLRAARLADTPGASRGAIAVTIEPASPEERRALLCRSCGLTPRETELVGHLATGGDTREVAHRMGLSEHTVQDHLKSVFTKTATRSRRDLLARITGS
jgi:DNA-binding CsgD family transcriptional regulator